MSDKHSNELVEAVSQCDLQGVDNALLAGADPNYQWTVDGEPGAGPAQPTSPLALLMFRISDSLLNDADLRACAKIADVLLHHGANPDPALRLAESRYGPYDASATGAFAEVWHVVARAKEPSAALDIESLATSVQELVRDFQAQVLELPIAAHERSSFWMRRDDESILFGVTSSNGGSDETAHDIDHVHELLFDNEGALHIRCNGDEIDPPANQWVLDNVRVLLRDVATVELTRLRRSTASNPKRPSTP